MANPVTFDAYLRYVRWQSSPAEAGAVRVWLAQPTHAGLALAWMQQYTQLLAQEAEPTSSMPDFEAVQDTLLTQLQLSLASAPSEPKTSNLPSLAGCFRFPFRTQELLSLRAVFHRLYWQ